MFGSNLVASLMHRIPWLVYVGAAILIYTAGDMIFSDPIVGRFLPDTPSGWRSITIVTLLDRARSAGASGAIPGSGGILAYLRRH